MLVNIKIYLPDMASAAKRLVPDNLFQCLGRNIILSHRSIKYENTKWKTSHNGCCTKFILKKSNNCPGRHTPHKPLWKRQPPFIEPTPLQLSLRILIPNNISRHFSQLIIRSIKYFCFQPSLFQHLQKIQRYQQFSTHIYLYYNSFRWKAGYLHFHWYSKL